MAAGPFSTVGDHGLIMGQFKAYEDSALETFVLCANNSFGAYSFASLKSTYFVSYTYDGQADGV